MLVTLKELLTEAQKNKYAVGAFTIWNIDYVRAVVEAAEELNSPVIIMFGPVEIGYTGKYGIEILSEIALFYIKRTKIPVALHLDHSTSVELLAEAIKIGVSSVMFDGSRLSYAENISNTKKVVTIAKRKGVSVEGELGKVPGLEGVPGYSEEKFKNGEDIYTNPDQAKEFVDKTGVDALAVSIGTAHGIYKVNPKLDINRLKQIRNKMDIPLVLHGGSDTPAYMLKKTIAEGISKINIATDLKVAGVNGILKITEKNGTKSDLKDIYTETKKSVKEMVKKKILICGSENKIYRLF